MAFFFTEGCDQVNKLDVAARSVVDESLARYYPPKRFELSGQITSCFLDCISSRRTRAEVHHRFHMSQRFFTREFLPDCGGRGLGGVERLL